MVNPGVPLTRNWKIRNGRLHVRSEFISPALHRDADGYFLTADCADSDGHERFILRGRADDIVKIGGKRVDLTAVQAKLKHIPGVRDAVVVAIPTGKGHQNELGPCGNPSQCASIEAAYCRGQ